MLSKLFVILFLVECDCWWVTEVGLVAYWNREGKALANINTPDQCCDPPQTAGRCSNECDTYFTFCLQSVSEAGLGSCVYGRYNTSEVGGDRISFQRGDALDSAATPNPLVFSGDQWPNDSMVSLVVFAYDNDSAAESSADFDLIGSATVSLMLIANGMVGQFSIDGQFYELSIDYRTVCAFGYYGPDCSTLCVPRDDEEGHYECDSKGNISCLQGYTGPDTNCTVAETCVSLCADNEHCNASSVCECSVKNCDNTAPVCEGGCSNGGVCVLPNTCQCAEGWEGSACQLSSTSSTAVDNSSNELVILYAVGAILAFAIFAVGITIAVIVIKRKQRFRQQSKMQTSKEDPVSHNAVNNPNYSPTSIGSQHTLAIQSYTANSIDGLDNPLYSKSNSSTDIIAGYSLVSLAEETSVYYSSAVEPTEVKKPFYDSIRPTSLRKPVYYSQPILNSADSNDNYGYAETRICVERIEEKEPNDSKNCKKLYVNLCVQ